MERFVRATDVFQQVYSVWKSAMAVNLDQSCHDDRFAIVVRMLTASKLSLSFATITGSKFFFSKVNLGHDPIEHFLSPIAA